MMRHVLAALALAIGAAAPVYADPGTSYGQQLVDMIAARHPAVSAIEITAADPQGRELHYTHHRAATAGQPVSAPLLSGMGDPIGTLTVTSSRAADAHAVAAELAHRLYTAGVLAEPVPFTPDALRSPRGQALVEQVIDATPGLVTLAMHVALPGHANMIVASNFGRIGKAADKDDAHVIADGAILKETTNAGRRLAVELPLLDARHRTIGALSTSFLLAPDRDPAAAYAQAVALRDRLARRIPTLASLAAR